VREEKFLEDGGRHHAGLAAGQGRDVGGARHTVEGSQLAEQVAGPHLVEDDLFAGGRAHEDPDLARKEEIDVRGGLVEVDQDLLGIEAAPIGPRLGTLKVDVQSLEQLNPGEPRHRSPPPECYPWL